MKKVFLTLCVAAAALFVPTGCSKSNLGADANPLGVAFKDIPDLSNFAVQATTAFVAGAQTLIHIFSTTLADGQYTVNFNLSGNNTFSGSATLTMNGGTGTFTTPVMGSAGPTTATVTSVVNSAGHSSTPPSTMNNVTSMFDSSGYMGANYTLANGTVTQFVTNQVTATVTGTLLSIHGVMWEPILTTITITDFNYSGAPGVVNVNGTAGSLSYGEAGNGIAISEIASSGSYTITTTTPLLTGRFSVTNPDNSKVVGTFSCAP